MLGNTVAARPCFHVTGCFFLASISPAGREGSTFITGGQTAAVISSDQTEASIRSMCQCAACRS